MAPRIFASVALVVLAACVSQDEGEGKSTESTLPVPPANGAQYLLAPVEVPAGSERQFCYYTTSKNETDVWVQGYQAFQGDGGHHIIAFRTIENVPDGTVIDCTDGAAMARWLPLLLANDVDGLRLPAGYGIKLPAKTRLVFQTHYVNARPEALKATDAVNIQYVDNPASVIPAAPFANTTLDFEIPPKSKTAVEYDCDVDRQMNVFALLGHMHEHGAHLTIKAGPKENLATVYDRSDWNVGFRDTPPVITWPVDKPLVLNKGDQVRVSCSYNNTSDRALRFPEEMCASLFWFFPATDAVTCGASARVK